MRKRIAISTVAAVSVSTLIAACGGGGGDSSGSAASAPPAAAPPPATAPVASGAQATVATPATSKLPWRIATPLSISLKDANGAAVSGALSCSTTHAELTISADCSAATGQRLGSYDFTVSGSGQTAQASLTVIPQAQPFPVGGASLNALGIVTPSGNVLTWGSNFTSGLGQGKDSAAQVTSPLPGSVKDSAGTGILTSIVSASIGSDGAFALTESGQLWFWGRNQERIAGQTSGVGVYLLPVAVSNSAGNGPLQRVVSAVTGGRNATALLDDGSVYSWGQYNGQSSTLKDPLFVPTPVPRPEGGPLNNGTAISSSDASTAVLTSEGKVITWGFNTSSALGQGISDSTAAIIPSPGYVLRASDGAPLDNIVAISFGSQFALALTNAGQVYAWGANSWGTAGQGAAGGYYPRAVLVKSPDGAGPLSGIKSIATGAVFALALTDSGEVLSWGLGSTGTLGDGISRPRGNFSALPGPVMAPSGTSGLSGVVAIGAASNQGFALDSSGSVLIWGQAYPDMLGQGSGTTANSPLPIALKTPDGTGSLPIGPVSYWPNPTRRATP